MRLNIYQIDAFASKVFQGNPAAVIPLQSWLSDDIMQSIASENNLSETAFFVKEDEKYHIRWFTPLSEVDMCGHATLASAFVLFNILDYKKDKIIFSSKSGDLSVKLVGKLLEMNFPIQEIKKCKCPLNILKAFNFKPKECYKSMDYIVVFDDEEQIRDIKIDIDVLKSLDARGVIVTAKAKECDFVCRFFAPKLGIDEDLVTGSAYTQLVPYWNKLINKNTFYAKQLSKRGGDIFCELKDERVNISGYAVKYLDGYIEV